MDIFDTLFSESLQDLWISTAFIIVTLIISEIFRVIIYYIFKGREGVTKKLINEFIATGELCACCFELCIIADNYGIHAYATYLFLLTVWWSYRWGDASACPYTHIEDLLQGQATFKYVLLVVFVQVFSGWAIYPFYVKKFWLMQYERKHVEHVEACSADLTVPAMHGAVIEGLSTCMCQLTGRVMSRLNPKHGIPITAVIGTTLVVAAFDMSGGYFNPVLATSLQFNCGEITRTEHFEVYWLGAIIGSILSVLIWHSTTLSRKLLGDITRIKID
ncbi:aquaporin-11 [Folsomia candida]|uniref:Aquaporin n=1 Tax=Folsomia candida TaxID=158441 RepID=A0A226EU18_FOLCA|nr:aquaporin-11 [Folsomia candida]OXA60708.1 Aquaporin-12 [Folsomia candida]